MLPTLNNSTSSVRKNPFEGKVAHSNITEFGKDYASPTRPRVQKLQTLANVANDTRRDFVCNSKTLTKVNVVAQSNINGLRKDFASSTHPKEAYNTNTYDS